jgi:hypothetical protein
VRLFVNHEEHLLRALTDTGASSSVILEAFTSAPFIKTDDSNKPPGVRNKYVLLGQFMWMTVLSH